MKRRKKAAVSKLDSLRENIHILVRNNIKLRASNNTLSIELNTSKNKVNDLQKLLNKKKWWQFWKKA